MSSSLLARYWKAQDPYDPEALATCRHPQWSAEQPQTGERFPNHEADVKVHSNYPDYPRHQLGRGVGEGEQWAMTPLLTPVRVQGAGDLWIGEARLDYPEQGLWHAAMVFELKDEMIFKETAYFAEAFDAPEWRADLVEPIPDVDSTEGEFHEVAPDPEGQRAMEAAVHRYFAVPSSASTPEETRELYQQGIRDLFHPDAVQDLVQTGERIRGLDRILDLVGRHPDFPRLDHVKRIVGVGDAVVAEAKLLYDQGDFWEVMIFGFRGDKVISTTEYYAPESEAPEWRSQWVERI
jgi:hypothetical protein